MMRLLRAYKTELDPTDVQRTMLLQHAGCARAAYNWGLQRKIEAYQKTGTSPSAVDLHRELTRLKAIPKASGGFSWMRESSKCAPQEALRNLDQAFRNFFRRRKAKAKKAGFPRFKSRKRGVGRFRLVGAIKVSVCRIQLPRLGSLRLKEHGYLPVRGAKILFATISEKAGRWFVSLQVEENPPELQLHPEVVMGVDVGISHLAVVSDGRIFDNPKALALAERHLRRLQKAVSRKERGSKNRKKAVARVAQQYYRIGNVRRDSLHKTSSAIAKLATVVVLESLNVAGMLGNRRLSKALSDASISELHRQIEYKIAWQGGRVIKADRWFPSSKTCSGCGAVKDALDLNERTYRCQACGLVIDRDLNAAINLRNLAGSSPVSACGETSAGRRCEAATKLVPVKQGPNTARIYPNG